MRVIQVVLIVALMLLPLFSYTFAQDEIVPPALPTYILSVPKLIRPFDCAVSQCFGEARMIATTFINNDDKPVQFVVFLEIRDSAGVTVFLQFHTGAAEGRLGHNTLEMASSWQPEKAGTYELRTFAISNFTRPEVLVCCTAPVNMTID